MILVSLYAETTKPVSEYIYNMYAQGNRTRDVSMKKGTTQAAEQYDARGKYTTNDRPMPCICMCGIGPRETAIVLKRNMFVVCGCSIRVRGYLAVSYILGFRIMCRGIIRYMPRSVELPPAGQSMMLMIRPGL